MLRELAVIKAVKEYLIRQFELSPRLYLSRFNNMLCRCVMLPKLVFLSVCDLTLCYKYYLKSRNASSLEKLFSLLFSDRV
jgi:hypothetical protein